jgi:hypothetical protein
MPPCTRPPVLGDAADKWAGPATSSASFCLYGSFGGTTVADGSPRAVSDRYV